MTKEKNELNKELNDVDVMSRTMAALFYFLADEVINTYGEDAVKVIKRAMERFGLHRGQKIREKVLHEGEQLTLENLFKYYDMPLLKAWEMEAEDTPQKRVSCVSYCPMAVQWKELEGEEIGQLYCTVDPYLVQGYNPELSFWHEGTIPQGEKECKLVYDACEQGNIK